MYSNQEEIIYHANNKTQNNEQIYRFKDKKKKVTAHFVFYLAFKFEKNRNSIQIYPMKPYKNREMKKSLMN